MIPFVVSSQVNDRVISTLKSEGFRIGSDMILRKRDKPYMNAALFAEYVSAVFLSDIAKIRSDPRFTDKEAVLLMDNCSLHLREDILQTLADYHVKVVAFPLHTTKIFQWLDLSLVGVLRKK